MTARRSSPASNLTRAEFAAIQPMTEALTFLWNVTGIVDVDLHRNLAGEVIGAIARGKRGLEIGLRLEEPSHD